MLLSRGFLRERPRQHELGLENRPAARDNAIKGRTHPPEHRMTELMLHAFHGLPGIALVPVSVEGFGDESKLDDEIARLVLQLDLAAFLTPAAEHGRFVCAPYGQC